MAEFEEELMGQSETTIWGIHGGRTGDADSLFLKHKVVALGWSKMGNLAALGVEREAFKTAVSEAYPDKKPGAIPNNAGQLFRFVHEIQVGDLIVYPSKKDRRLSWNRPFTNRTRGSSMAGGSPRVSKAPFPACACQSSGRPSKLSKPTNRESG